MSVATVRQAAEYGLFLALYGVVRTLPHATARRLGSLLGAAAHALDRRHRRVARANVGAVFTELDEIAVKRLVGDCFRHFGAFVCDYLSQSRFTAEQLCRRLTVVGWEHLLRAEEEGRGVFLLTAHLGYFEMLAHPIALYRGPAHIIARPIDNPLLDRRVRGLRERFGNLTVPRRGAGRETLRALRAGARVFLLADQRVHPHEGIELPFLGRPAMTSTLAARLSRRCGSPVVPLFCYPEPGGRYRIEVHPAIHPDSAGSGAVAALTRRCVAATEAEIRRHPEMWLWMHDRWRQRDGGGPRR